MSTSEEQLMADYRRTRQELEEQEETIQDFKRNGRHYIEESQQNLWHLLQRIALDSEPMDEAQREYHYLEETYLEVLDKEKRKIMEKQDDAEQAYRTALRKLAEK